MDVHGGVIESDEWAGRNANPSILAVMEVRHRFSRYGFWVTAPKLRQQLQVKSPSGFGPQQGEAPCCSFLARCGAAQNDPVLLPAGLLSFTRLRVLLIPPFVSVPVARLILMLHYIK